jgi:hypothetical protein
MLQPEKPRPLMATKAKRRPLTQDDQRELARLLGVILERVYDGTLDVGGAAGVGIVRRIEGAKTVLEATLSAVPARKSGRQPR